MYRVRSELDWTKVAPIGWDGSKDSKSMIWRIVAVMEFLSVCGGEGGTIFYLRENS